MAASTAGDATSQSNQEKRSTSATMTMTDESCAALNAPSATDPQAVKLRTNN